MADVLKNSGQAISGRNMLVAVSEEEVIQLLAELCVGFPTHEQMPAPLRAPGDAFLGGDLTVLILILVAEGRRAVLTSAIGVIG